MKKTCVAILGLLTSLSALAQIFEPRIPVVVRDPIIVRPICRNMPDLVITQLPPPEWNSGSIIRAQIRNAGMASTGASSVVQLVVDGRDRHAQGIPALAAGQSFTVEFRLRYNVYNPDAQYEVEVDYGNLIRECIETNNKKSFFNLG